MLENLEGGLRTISDRIKKYKIAIRKSQTAQFQTELKNIKLQEENLIFFSSHVIIIS